MGDLYDQRVQAKLSLKRLIISQPILCFHKMRKVRIERLTVGSRLQRFSVEHALRLRCDWSQKTIYSPGLIQSLAIITQGSYTNLQNLIDSVSRKK